MCRNIKTLFNFEPPVTPDEIRAASLQFVRKISGFAKPSKANEAAFLAAVDEVAQVSERLHNTSGHPRDRPFHPPPSLARRALSNQAARVYARVLTLERLPPAAPHLQALCHIRDNCFA